MRDLIEANRAAREALRVNEEILDRSIERHLAGEGIAEVFLTSPSGEQRQVTQDAFDFVASTRHAYRLRIIAALMEHGMPMWEIATVWGFSRQRVDRYVQEIKRSQ